jgi:hypothetical protein
MTMRSPVSPEVRALLDQERVLPPVSASQRARATARARAALTSPLVPTAAPSSAASRSRWVAAAAAALVISAAVGAAAYEIRSRWAPAPPTRRAVVWAPAVASAPAVSPPVVAVPELLPAPTPAVAAPGSSPADAARAELHLLREARAAVARGDFAAALPPIAEHARRFKNGRLVEEREALRVKALGGLGRTAEARRAAAAFRARFPRSVLLPAVSQMPASGP